MTDLDIMAQALELMEKWKANGETQSFMEYWQSKTGFEIESDEFAIVLKMIMGI